MSVEAAVAAVEKWGRDNEIIPGSQWYSGVKWADPRQLRTVEHYDFTATDLQKAAKQGLIAIHERSQTSYRGRRFTRRSYASLKQVADAEAEAGLSVEERAQRFMEYFVPFYEKERLGWRGDNPRQWPVRPFEFEADIEAAHECDLITPIKVHNETRYIPTAHFDAYTEALELQEQRERKAQQRFEGAVKQLDGLIPHRVQGQTIILDIAGIEAILEIVGG